MSDRIPRTPVPEWETSKVILVDPGIWADYREPAGDLRPVYHELRAALDALGIEHEVLTVDDFPADIWIRDWGFVAGHYFRFKPSYAKGVYPPGLVAKARRMLDQRLGCRPQTVPLVLDGGNFIHNGKTAILTEKVLKDNPAMSKAAVERTILDLGFEQVVFIPVEPEDDVGHADGIVRFISADVLLVNDYTGSDFTEYRKRLMRVLETSGIGVRIVPFPCFSTNEKKGRVWSAAGVYINFILTRHGIAYPIFNHPLDEEAARVLAENTTLPLRPILASPLARHGGVLNCVTLTVKPFATVSRFRRPRPSPTRHKS
jgi:agmatine/peptidylarginine deiminase